MGPNQSHTRKVEFVANIPLRKIFLVQKLRKSFKMVFVTLEKCLGQNRSSFLKKAFLHGLHPTRDPAGLERPSTTSVLAQFKRLIRIFGTRF